MVINGNKMAVGTWYKNKYPTDELGVFIKPDLTFGDLWDCLKKGSDIYDCMGVGDSVARERMFVKLAEIFNVSYDYIYGMWLASC